MPVNDDPTPQWFSKVDFNVIIAFIATSEGSGEGHHPNLYVDVRLPERHSRGPVAGSNTKIESLRGKQHRFHYPHFAAPSAPAEAMPNHETGHKNHQPGHQNCDNYGSQTAG